MRTIIVAMAVAVIGCPPPPPQPPPQPPPSDDVMVDAEAACSNLRRLGCPEGQGSIAGLSCAVIVVRASALRQLPLSCWTSAATIAVAKACGSLRCVR